MTFNKMSTLWITVILLVVTPVQDKIHVADAFGGVCLGLNGNNLPPANDIVNLYYKHNIRFIRLFEPVPEILKALDSSTEQVVLGVRNEDTPKLASSLEGATDWLKGLIAMIPRVVQIPYMTIGNEIVPGEFAQYIPQAIINLKAALRNLGNTGTVVTTVVGLNVLAMSYPPSAGAFTDEARPFMVDILKLLSANQAQIFINVYPYFAYASNPARYVSLDYALFNKHAPVLQDGPYRYYNLFDAMVDAFVSAMEKEQITNVGVLISESGWPSAGNGALTTPEIAGTYNRNFAKHLMNYGTPKRPSAGMIGFIFAMFEENLKPGDAVEQHFGLFYPNMEPVYPLPVFSPPATNNNSTLISSPFSPADINISTLIGSRFI